MTTTWPPPAAWTPSGAALASSNGHAGRAGNCPTSARHSTAASRAATTAPPWNWPDPCGFSGVTWASSERAATTSTARWPPSPPRTEPGPDRSGSPPTSRSSRATYPWRASGPRKASRAPGGTATATARPTPTFASPGPACSPATWRARGRTRCAEQPGYGRPSPARQACSPSPSSWPWPPPSAVTSTRRWRSCARRAVTARRVENSPSGPWATTSAPWPSWAGGGRGGLRRGQGGAGGQVAAAGRGRRRARHRPARPDRRRRR